MTLKPLVFFGTEEFSLPSLQALIDERWPIKLVITKPDSRRGRGLALRPPAIKILAEANGIPVLQPTGLTDIKDRLQAAGAELAVLVAYGKIIPQEIIDIFPSGIINVHPSLLPKYRGPAPIEAAILNGDEITGVSLMRLSARMDAGPIYIQEKIGLNGSETRPELYEHLAKIGAALLIKKLGAIADGSLEGREQDESLATYTELLKKEDGLTDFSETSQELERKVRAYAGFPKVRGSIFGKEIVITKSKPAENETDGGLVVKTAEGWLEIQELIAPSGKKVSGAEFVRGYKR
jgi:methionyl-tRNA formyltransferase